MSIIMPRALFTASQGCHETDVQWHHTQRSIKVYTLIVYIMKSRCLVIVML